MSFKGVEIYAEGLPDNVCPTKPSLNEFTLIQIA